MPRQTCLIVDDEPAIRLTLTLALESDGWDVLACPTAEAGRRMASSERLDLALLDLRLGTESGLELLTDLLKIHPGLPTLMITAYASLDSALEAMRRGATDYLPKPFLPDEVRQAARQAVARKAASAAIVPATAIAVPGAVEQAGLLPQELPTLERLEESYIRRVLAVAPSIEQAAKILGMDKVTLWRKRKRYRIY